MAKAEKGHGNGVIVTVEINIIWNQIFRSTRRITPKRVAS